MLILHEEIEEICDEVKLHISSLVIWYVLSKSKIQRINSSMIAFLLFRDCEGCTKDNWVYLAVGEERNWANEV
ncbi:MAG: hypothetical protein ACYTX0_44225, partial [Nostoc sp.]